MLEHLASRCVAIMRNNEIIDSELSDVYQYGLELLLSSVIGCIVIIGIGFSFFSVIDTLIFLLLFVLIRSYSGGYHAGSYLTCNLTVVTVFIVTMIINEYANLGIGLIFTVAIISLVVNLSICPVESKAKEITIGEKKKYKIIAAMLMFIAQTISLSLFILNIKYYQIVSLTVFDILILMIIGHIKNIKGGEKPYEEGN